MLVWRGYRAYLFLLTILTLGFHNIALATGAVDIEANWKVGDKHSLEMTKTTFTGTAGEMRQIRKAIIPVTTEVLRKSDEGYVVRWTYGRMKLVGESSNPMLEKFARITENLSIDLRTDMYGILVGLENPNDVNAHFRSAAAEILDWAEASNIKDPETLAFKAALANFSNPRVIAGVALKEPGLFFLPIGGLYRDGEVIEYDDVMPNPFGGNPFPARARLSLIGHDDQIAELGLEQTVDREKGASIILKALEDMGVPSGFDTLSFQFEDEGQWTIDIEDTFPLAFHWTRLTDFAGQRTIDQLSFQTID